MADPRSEEAAALAALDAVLAKRPQKDSPEFTTALEHLCTLRDRLIADRRAGIDSGERLDTVNALITTVLGGRFPLGTVPWPSIEAARATLARLTH